MSTNGYRSAWQSQPNDQLRQDDLMLASQDPSAQGQHI